MYKLHFKDIKYINKKSYCLELFFRCNEEFFLNKDKKMQKIKYLSASKATGNFGGYITPSYN